MRLAYTKIVCFTLVVLMLSTASICFGNRANPARKGDRGKNRMAFEAPGRSRVNAGSRTRRQWRVGMLRAATDNNHVIKDPLTAIVRAIRRNPDLDMLIGPEWLFVPKKLVHSAADFRKIQRTIEKESKGKPMLIAPGTIAWKSRNKYQNTMLSISDGKTLSTYSKRSFSGDETLACRAKIALESGKNTGIFSWKRSGRTFSVGVEICADHMTRSLFHDTRVTRSSRPLDIHLLSSNAGFNLMDSSLSIGVGGLFVSNNGNANHRGGQLSVKRFRKEKPRSKRSLLGLSRIDEYTGWHESQIAWAEGKVQKQEKLTSDVDLIVYSVPAPK